MKLPTIYCPACGNRCTVTPDGPMEYKARCVRGHGWAVTVDMDNAASADGSAILGFQCDGTPAGELFK